MLQCCIANESRWDQDLGVIRVTIERALYVLVRRLHSVAEALWVGSAGGRCKMPLKGCILVILQLLLVRLLQLRSETSNVRSVEADLSRKTLMMVELRSHGCLLLSGILLTLFPLISRAEQ